MIRFDATVSFEDPGVLEAEIATKLALAGVKDGTPMVAIVYGDDRRDGDGEIFVGEEEYGELQDDDWRVLGYSARELAGKLRACL